MQVKFESLLKGIQHHPNCPLCQSDLTPVCESFDSTYILLKLLGNNTLRVNLEPQTVVREPAFGQESGNYMRFLILDCQTCYKFGYVLTLTFDLDVPRLVSICLDSEILLWEDFNNTLHEVHSRYPTETSKYSVFPASPKTRISLLRPVDLSSAKEAKITLPFIPIDFSNPQETIQQAQTMAVFS